MKSLPIAGLAILLAAPAAAAKPDVKGVEAVHAAYVAAINSNDIERVMAMLTEGVVYQSPGEPEIVGKAAVRTWGTAYFTAYRTHWDKTAAGVVVSGDWAYERYSYKVADKDRKTGLLSSDSGKGINIFHHDADGKWRVSVDGWSSDKPGH